MATQSAADKIPHSWSVEDWPASVYPCRVSRARYIIRAHRDELVAAGALTRIGRDLVILGAGYSGWLAKQSGSVRSFEIAPNRDSTEQAVA